MARRSKGEARAMKLTICGKSYGKLSPRLNVLCRRCAQRLVGRELAHPRLVRGGWAYRGVHSLACLCNMCMHPAF
jgi:hypothetical protein